MNEVVKNYLKLDTQRRITLPKEFEDVVLIRLLPGKNADTWILTILVREK